jgi:hypothetical protein
MSKLLARLRSGLQVSKIVAAPMAFACRNLQDKRRSPAGGDAANDTSLRNTAFYNGQLALSSLSSAPSTLECRAFTPPAIIA